MCTGNVYRSFSAECLLKHYLNKNAIEGWEVFSAGIIAEKAEIDPEIITKLRSLGVKDISHEQHKLDGSMLEKFDPIIAMAEDHIDFIKKQFNYAHPFLFNELARNEKSSVWDIADNVKDFETNRKNVEQEMNRTIQHIYDSIPGLVDGINKLYL